MVGVWPRRAHMLQRVGPSPRDVSAALEHSWHACHRQAITRQVPSRTRQPVVSARRLFCAGTGRSSSAVGQPWVKSMASMAPRGSYGEGVRVTGQVVAARHLADGCVGGGRTGRQPGLRTIAWASSHLREAVEVDVGGTGAAMPEQTVAAMPGKDASLDVAWLVRRAADGDRHGRAPHRRRSSHPTSC